MKSLPFQGLPALSLFTFGLSSALFAGANNVEFKGIGTLTVTEEGNSQPWTIDFGSLLQHDPSTGIVTLSGTTPNANWTKKTFDVGGKIIDGFNWHSSETAMTPEGEKWRTTVDFYAWGNVDPELSYGVSFRNNTNAIQTYTYSYGESISPTVLGEYSLHSDIGGSLTNVGISTGAAFAPVSGLVQKLSFSHDGGNTLYNAGVDVGPGMSMPIGQTGTSIYGVYAQDITQNSALPIDYWQFDVALTLTPGRDSVALTGYAELIPIPEPSFFALLAGGIGLGYVSLRRRVVAA